MKQEIDFVKINPTQNMTILVKTDHPKAEYIPIAARLMSYDSVYAEQVGFINKSSNPAADARLQMAGGEFCGNACMAMAAYLAAENGLQPNVELEIALESSGTDRLVACRVSRANEKYACQVTMPLPAKVEQRTIPYEGEEIPVAIVRYDTFFHIVIEVEAFSRTWRNRAEGLARLLGIGLDSNLIGVLLFEPNSNEMAPLIYLPELESLIWEKGCGSGTASVGAYLAWKNKGNITSRIVQPGGTILVMADCCQQEITRLVIEGVVGIAAQGKAFIEWEGSGSHASGQPASAMFS